MGHLGFMLGSSWAILGPSWAILGAISGLFWAILNDLGPIKTKIAATAPHIDMLMQLNCVRKAVQPLQRRARADHGVRLGMEKNKCGGQENESCQRAPS